MMVGWILKFEMVPELKRYGKYISFVFKTSLFTSGHTNVSRSKRKHRKVFTQFITRLKTFQKTFNTRLNQVKIRTEQFKTSALLDKYAFWRGRHKTIISLDPFWHTSPVRLFWEWPVLGTLVWFQTFFPLLFSRASFCWT